MSEYANEKGIDGRFKTGALEGKTVNIKFYTKNQRGLDISQTPPRPDYFLVMTGEYSSANSSKGTSRPWVISNVYIFNSEKLINTLKEEVKIWVNTSVRKDLWDNAEIYPTPNNKEFQLSDEQKEKIKLFVHVISALSSVTK